MVTRRRIGKAVRRVHAGAQILMFVIASASSDASAQEHRCPIHGVSLQHDEVPVYDGLVDLGVRFAAMNPAGKFPFANESVWSGSCFGIALQSEEVLYCTRCREVKRDWERMEWDRVDRDLGTKSNYGPTEVRSLGFITTEGLIFDTRLYVPPIRTRNGAGVLLLGGGMGNDLDWSVPGAITVNGQEQQLTIDGTLHADAPRIAQALTRAGFVVMHMSTLCRDDPKRFLWPMDATIYPMEQQLAHIRRAVEVFRGQGLIDLDRLFLVGHSLGGARAAHIAGEDHGIAGLVLLGSAQATRTSPEDKGRNMNRAAAQSILDEVDSNSDGVLSFLELKATPNPFSELDDQALATLDFDRDGVLRVWEISARLAWLERESRADADWMPLISQTLRWTEDVLVERSIPTLFVYGAIDHAQAHHAPIVQSMIDAQQLPLVKVVVLPNLGHQLGAEHDGRMGPIDAQALTVVTQWLQELVPQE